MTYRFLLSSYNNITFGLSLVSSGCLCLCAHALPPPQHGRGPRRRPSPHYQNQQEGGEHPNRDGCAGASPSLPDCSVLRQEMPSLSPSKLGRRQGGGRGNRDGYACDYPRRFSLARLRYIPKPTNQATNQPSNQSTTIQPTHPIRPCQ